MASSFSWKLGINDFSVHRNVRTPSHLSVNKKPDLPSFSAYIQGPGLPTPGSHSLLRPHFTTYKKSRNINLVPIDYAFQPRLRGRLTLLRLTSCRKPWTSGVRVFHPHYRYSCQHSHFRYLQHTSQCTFISLQNAPLPHAHKCTSAASVTGLAPLNLPRRPTRPVSYYAFFKEWLLLSQSPGCLCLPTSFPTQSSLRDLSWRSGLFPSSRRTLAPAVCLP